MTRRTRVLTLVASLYGGLFSGCAHGLPWNGKPSGGRPAPTPSTFIQPAEVENAPSPYVPLAPPAPKETEKPTPEPAVEATPPAERPAPAIGLGTPADLKNEASKPNSLEPVVVSKPVEDPALVGALRCFLEKRPEEALFRLKNLDKPNQELLLGLLPLVTRLGEGNLSQASPQDLAALMDGLDSLLVPLRSRAPLTIDKMCFCQWIRGFGVYLPWPAEHRFRRGEPVLIYVQMRNFTSTEEKLPSGQSKQIVRLVSTGEIRDETGAKVLPHDIVFKRTGSQADESWTLRHDYFDCYRFYVPQSLPPGLYTLWIQVEDQGTNPARTVRGSLDFRVTNPDLPAQGS